MSKERQARQWKRSTVTDRLCISAGREVVEMFNCIHVMQYSDNRALTRLAGRVSRHFGPKTFRHWCWSVRKTLRYRSVFGVVCAIVCCNITIASRIGLAWRLCTRRNRFNAVYLKRDGTAIDWADRTASASHSRSVADVSHLSSANMPRTVKWLNCTVFFLETAAVWHLAGKLGFFDCHV